MKTLLNTMILATAFALAIPSFGAQAGAKGAAAKATTDAKATTAKAAKTVTPAPTAAEIADAKAKGMVWVNTETKVYHKDGKYYGNTKHGKFMTAADADKAGYRAAKESPIGKKKTTK